MRSSWTLFLLPLLCVAQPRQADVVIYGATSAGIAAAVQVSRMGKSVLIVDPGTHLGGLTTGGLGWTDIGNKQVIGGIAREFYRKVKAHYDQPESWKFQPRTSYYSLRHAEINAADDAMWTFEPKVATAIYQEMIAQYKIPIVMKQRLDLRPGKGVIKTGPRITAIVMEPAKLEGIVIDDEQAAKSGKWTESRASAPYLGAGYLHDGNAHDGKASASFRVAIPSPGAYRVRVLYPVNANRATNATVKIEAEAAPVTAHINQRQEPVWLGPYRASKSLVVTVSNPDADGYVVVDGVQVVPVPQ